MEKNYSTAGSDRVDTFRNRFAFRRTDFVIIFMVAVAVMISVYLRGNRANEGILGRPLRVGIVSWPGYAGGLVANNGLRTSKDSYYWTQHKLLVEFVEEPDETKLLAAFERGDFDVIWSTVDSLAHQAPALIKKGIRPRAFMQVDYSRGGDAIIASADIERVEDLKGKRVAVPKSASQWLFEDSLANASLTDEDRKAIRQSRVPTRGSEEAADFFANNEVDAAVLWEPDVTRALELRPGSHRLIDTQDATKLIADVMVAKKEFIEQHKNVISAFVEGWLYGTTQAIKDPTMAVRVLQEEGGFASLDENKIHELLGTTAWATLNDNVEMFGLSDGRAYFDELFNRASTLWVKQGYMDDSVQAEDVRDTSCLKEVYVRNKLMLGQSCGKETPMLTINLAIPFQPNKPDLGSNARSILDNQAAMFILQTHAGARFCLQAQPVEGDNPQTAADIALRREITVADYLESHYKRPRGQFASASIVTSELSSGGARRARYIRLRLTTGTEQREGAPLFVTRK